MEDLFSLQGKVAMVTGGYRGIGKGIADGFASKGSDIIIAARNEAKTVEAAQDIKERFGVQAIGVHVNIRQEASVLAAVKQALREFEQINILVNDAGINIRKSPQDYAVAEWDEILEVNLRGAFLCSRAVYPSMKEAGGGKIISIGSTASLGGAPTLVPYACSKGGIVQLTYGLALAWAKDNIQVNAILPGWVETPLSMSARKDRPGLMEHVINRTPAGRWGKPEDIAGAAIFLASRASDFVTAGYIKLDGGYSRGLQIIWP